MELILTQCRLCILVVALFACSVKGDTVRLVGGYAPNEGKIQINHNGVWGTICDDRFGVEEARVICRMLGYDGEFARANDGTYSRKFGTLSGTIHLDDLSCSGSETNIDNCRTKDWDVHDCSHSEDAGVFCADEVYLVGGNNPNEGTIQIKHGNEWGTVCDDSFGNNDARVICRMLGYYGNAVAYSSANWGQGTGDILLDDLKCSGTERHVSLCPSNGWGNDNCGHGEDAGVRCSQNKIYLSGGQGPYEGTVNIEHNGVWGSVCDDSFGVEEARVICRMLGYTTSHAVAFSSAYFGTGHGPILLDDLRCTGSELDLASCDHRTWNTSNCGHSEDAGVRCGGGKLYCYNCDRVPSPKYCDTVRECASFEVCSVQRHGQSTQAFYRSKCESDVVCANLKHTSASHSDTCVECCNDDFCNRKGCGQSDLVQQPQRGPVCFDCTYSPTISQCTAVTVCERDKVCTIEEHRFGDNSFYHMGCTDAGCGDINDEATGDVRKRSSVRCKSCCATDYCNHNCTGTSNFPGIIG